MWRRLLNWGVFFDLAATVPAVVHAVYCINRLFSGVKFAELEVMLGIVIISAANLLWLPYRMMPLTLSLAERRRREELALTLLTPREYLWPRVRWTLLRAMLPWLCGAFPMLIALMIDSITDIVSPYCWYMCIFLTTYIAMLGFTVKNFEHACLMQSLGYSGSQFLFFTAPLIAFILFTSLSIGVPWIAMLFLEPNSASEGMIILVPYYIALGAVFVHWTRDVVRKALWGFFQFESPGGSIPPGRDRRRSG
ncbi:hypothetical protein JXA32_12280 [Candidatus Sumerlaeota bacterium]|nr:hypothetical protein [Candidatus Sumerlaeota bacterium]